MNLSEKIKNLRSKAGITQVQLADKIGVSAQTVSKWENDVSMPDITLLPSLSEVFGISIDELFDFSVEQKINRIENRIEIEAELPERVFKDYEEYLLAQLSYDEHKQRVLSTLAQLYHHRIEADSRRISKYGREAILLDPAKKGCQWLLNKAEGHAVWDWNCSNHSAAIDFYKTVIAADKQEPKTPMPYYYLIDNLLADNRADEAEKYLKMLEAIPAANPVLVDVYKAYIALARFDVSVGDDIIATCVKEHPEDSGYLFEAAQYYARRCKYEQALSLYERSWNADKAPRYTDSLDAIAIIHKIKGDKKRASETYDRILECLKTEWGYSVDDQPCLEITCKKADLLK